MYGKNRTREYRVWINMRSRCNNPNNPSYKDYGGRGIRVVQKWDSFPEFLADMGPCPPGMTLDRLNNNKGYGPVNCKWRSQYDQNRNRRNNIWITWYGRKMILKDWAGFLGIEYHTLHARFLLGWSVEKAFTQPVKKYNR